MKNLVFNSDDFGLSKESNLAIMEGYTKGALTSTCITPNGDFYEHGLKEILPEIPNIGKGIHLNIIEGKSLTNPMLFSDSDGRFNKGFLYFFYNSNNKKLLAEIEDEFRAQIEKIMADTEIDHINSHVHTHGIPSLFNLTLKLALEYKIKHVRLQYEKPYFVPKLNKIINAKYPINLVKLALLNNLSVINKNTVKSLNSKSEIKRIEINDYLIGVNFTGYMDKDTILSGLNALSNKENTITEIIIHPKYLTSDKNKTNYKELLASTEPELKEKIQALGFNLTNYKELNNELNFESTDAASGSKVSFC